MPVGAVDACVWGYPLVLFDAAARRNAQSDDAALAGVSMPNDDLAVRTAWIDLHHRPVALRADETTRYYSLSLFDAWGRSFASLGTRTTGNQRQTYAIVTPSWGGTAPNGVRTIEAPTNRVAVVAQTVRADGDIADLQVSIAPIGPRDNDRATAIADASGSPSGSVADAIAHAGGLAFFERLRGLLDDSGRYSSAIGWRDAIDEVLRSDSRALEAGFTEALGYIESGLPVTATVDGWEAQQRFDARSTAYLERARSCRFHFLAGDEQDVLYRFARTDDAGQPLHGARAYRLHFEGWNRPPARAFWSLTACDKQLRRLPADVRHSSIRSRDNLVRNADDSLDITIQRAPPDESSVNWLALPDQAFGLIFRLYWPRPAALSGVWSPPALHAVRVTA
jgi:hypothetical protein